MGVVGGIVRMWNVHPEMMCRRHLLGEHCEMHMFAGCIQKRKSINGYVEKGLVETGNIGKRHDSLAREMERRGYRHASPLRPPKCGIGGRVDSGKSARELRKRCRECRSRQSRPQT